MSARGSEQKLRGGYYTPREIADFICNWAIESPYSTILEPSCGAGVFLTSAAEKLITLGAPREKISNLLIGIELYEKEAVKAVNNLANIGISNSQDMVIVSDFFQFYRDMKGKTQYDVIIGNPPFIRYQNFPEEYRERAIQYMRELGLNPNRYTNTWVPFLILSMALLKKGGKIGMIIPAELFQVHYAAETREFLSNNLEKLTIVIFKKLLFKNVQQEVVLILGQKNVDEQSLIRIVEFVDLEDLSKFNRSSIDIKTLHLNEYKPLLKSDEKWTLYFLDKEEIELLSEIKKHPNIKWSSDFYEVDVGVVTGRNEFFILNEEKKQKLGLHDEVSEIVTRSAHLSGLTYSEEDHLNNRIIGRSTNLFKPSPLHGLSENAKAYILSGEEAEYHLGYKCRIRDPWYIVPSVWRPDAFMLRQVHDFPKLILNKSEATCTDTIHRVKIKKGVENNIIPAFINSVTFAFSEITGRSYGGGVLTFEPSEAERLPIPEKNIDRLDIEKSDLILRTEGVYSVLEIHDKILLEDGLGFSKEKILSFRSIWEKMRDRRINRK